MPRSAAYDDETLEPIYRQLLKGAGRELVNDDNVEALIRRAQRDNRTVLVELLREWQLPCGPADSYAHTIAPTRGFNRENVKH